MLIDSNQRIPSHYRNTLSASCAPAAMPADLEKDTWSPRESAPLQIIPKPPSSGSSWRPIGELAATFGVAAVAGVGAHLLAGLPAVAEATGNIAPWAPAVACGLTGLCGMAWWFASNDLAAQKNA